MTKDGMNVSLDTTDESECNWLCLVKAASSFEEQNIIAYQLGTSIFYSTTKDVGPNTELKVWYAPQYARRLGKNVEPDGISKGRLYDTQLIHKRPFASIHGDRGSSSHFFPIPRPSIHLVSLDYCWFVSQSNSCITIFVTCLLLSFLII